jgi:hypothetical protein
MLFVCNHLSHNEKLVRANCEVCGGARLKISSRKRYLITAGLYMTLFGLFSYLYLAGHNLNLYVGLLSGALLIASVIACVWFVLWPAPAAKPPINAGRAATTIGWIPERLRFILLKG